MEWKEWKDGKGGMKENRGEGKKDRRREEENQRRIGNGRIEKKVVIDWVRSWFGECNNQTDQRGNTYMMSLYHGEV